ncbi:MAG: hypothetical protein M1812_006065 [Candelaria pacifica]|nr:MAG: hypothetical protein M1812_006065 [Candelaria pacifica]
MAGIKRSHDGEQSNASPFMPMFEDFRNELDEHHDRRERVIKASRDITALSKKIIFALQRVRHLPSSLPSSVTSETSKHQSTIKTLFTSLTTDLQGIHSWRYQRQISPGIQEYMEAVSFAHYLQTQTLITHPSAARSIPGDIQLTEDDYILGLFDLVGELMRFAITAMATSGSLPGSSTPETNPNTSNINAEDQSTPSQRNILTDLRSLRTHFETLDTTSSTAANSTLGKDVEKKMEVMKTCVEKVENSVYGMIIRGRERPKGWIPDLRSGEGRETVESY